MTRLTAAFVNLCKAFFLLPLDTHVNPGTGGKLRSTQTFETGAQVTGGCTA